MKTDKVLWTLHCLVVILNDMKFKVEWPTLADFGRLWQPCQNLPKPTKVCHSIARIPCCHKFQMFLISHDQILLSLLLGIWYSSQKGYHFRMDILNTILNASDKFCENTHPLFHKMHVKRFFWVYYSYHLPNIPTPSHWISDMAGRQKSAT
jgi:hypothetical protein